MRRRQVLALALFGGLSWSCRRKVTPPRIEAPPGRPDDVRIELLVRDPRASWDRVRDLMGMAALPLPRTPYGLFAQWSGSPSVLQERLEPSSPLVAVLCADAPSAYALAWKLDDPDRASKLDADGLKLAPGGSGVRFVRTRGDADPGRFPLAVTDRFLLSGSSDTAISSHAPYLVRGLAQTDGDADLRIEVLRDGLSDERWTQALRGLDAFAAALDTKDPDAPTETRATFVALSAFVRTLRTIATEGKASPATVTVTARIAGDRLSLGVTPQGSSTTKAEIPGGVLRWWLTSKAKENLLR